MDYLLLQPLSLRFINLSQYEPPMARVRSKEEGETLAHSCQHFLIDAPLGGKLATTSKVPCLPLLTLNVHVPGFTLGTWIWG